MDEFECQCLLEVCVCWAVGARVMGAGVYVVVVCPYEGLYVWGDVCVRLWGCGVSMFISEFL